MAGLAGGQGRSWSGKRRPGARARARAVVPAGSPAAQLQPLVAPQVLHFMQVPFLTSV